jgi:Transposase IS116/IS110/IS902 family
VDAQIKLSVVASDSFGASGRSMLAALIAGERDPKVLAELARTRLRAKRGLLEEAFVGRFGDHHAFLLNTMLARVDQASADIADLDRRIEAELAPFTPAADRLDEITGVGRTAAQVIIAEIGVDMGRFPTAGHLVSWARFAPGVKESAGKRKGNATTGHGNPYLARVLGEAAVAAGRTNTLLGERYRRIARRRGAKRAMVAVGRSILIIVWHLLSDPTVRYQDSALASTTPASTPNAASATMSASWRPSATRSPSNPPPDPHSSTLSTLLGPGFAALRRVLPPAHSPSIFGLGPDLEHQVEGRIHGQPDLPEPGLGHQLTQPRLPHLVTQTQS